MALTPTQRTIVAKALASGGGRLGIGLDHAACSYLVAVAARDLGLLEHLSELGYPVSADIPEFFSSSSPGALRLEEVDFLAGFEILVTREPAAETFFACLAALHKARLKYERILQHQPLPTMDQVGPRALLQYGSLSAGPLAAFLFWRKWMFDIDNRAAQETGYLFEPIISASIGGTPLSARKSPVKRKSDPRKGRQVDCVREVGTEQWAYELKLRVTDAASGQGRWREELDFPEDCQFSGLKPVLVVLDSTENPKLTELAKKFEDCGGEFFLGPRAWEHLEQAAGATMAVFLERYVRSPIQRVLEAAPGDAASLDDLALSMTETEFRASVGGDELVMPRAADLAYEADEVDLVEDVDDELPIL